jgi:hypothetical protein
MISPLYLKLILEISTLELRLDVIFEEMFNNILCSIFSLFKKKRTHEVSSK